ncbi:High cysteine membrane protein Group 1 [Giardia lamblia P15]|uniref:High cysteine membrane protein Group 1 n=1 Tax=Giardia intestinalis (strain P15) TaxID=658858 RepID=E1F2S0_GIAIA|nr:High cysteine membrane protein Group 1 [Giardia lamblia P15]
MLVLPVGLLVLRAVHTKVFSPVGITASSIKCYHSLKLGEDTVCTDCGTLNTVPINGVCVPDDPNICIILQGYNTKCGSCTSDYMLFEDGCYDLNGKYASLICTPENRYVLEGTTYCSRCAYLDYVPVNGICDSASLFDTCANNVCTKCGFSSFLFNGGCVSKSSSLGKLVCAGTVSDGKCTQCADGFSADATGMCVPCESPNCSSCPDDKNTCSSCKEGFFLDSTSVCVLCKHHCAVCSSEYDCTKCRANAQELTIGSEKVCIGCGDTSSQHGGYLGIEFCAQCTLPSIPGPVQCHKCFQNYYSLTDSTTGFVSCYAACPIGTYGDTYSMSCKSCSANCRICEGSYGCTECVPGYYLDFMSCTPCKIPGCSKCTSNYAGDICEMCLPETPYMNLAGTECVASCPVGSKPDTGTPTKCICDFGYGLAESKNACVKCSDKYCKLCTENSNVCTECFYGNKADETAECPPPVCADNCISCTQAGHNFCDVCQEGFRLTADLKCARCSDENCLTCADDVAVCTRCQYGFRISSSGTCIQCGLGCKVCNESMCIECSNAAHSIGIDGISCDAECPSHSTPVSDDNTSRCVCNDGYIPELEARLCVEEPKICPLGCICETAPICNGCADGFFEKDPNRIDSGRCHSCALTTDSQGGQTTTGCKTCRLVEDTVLCNECLPNYKLYDSNGVIHCMKTCPSGTHDTGSHCVKCLTNNCMQCNTDKAACEMCVREYYLWENECISCNSLECAECGLSNICTKCMSTKKCNACAIPHCRTCNALGKCTVCEKGFYGPLCQPCGDNCLTCSLENFGVCLECQPGSIISMGNCYNMCTEGEGSGKCAVGSCNMQTGACMRCSVPSEFPINGLCTSDPHGNDCLAGRCVGCTAGYFFYGDGCYSLTAAPGNGICMASLRGYCTACHDGYSLQGNECVPCKVSGCAKCASDPTICELCTIEAYVVDPAGSSCVPECAVPNFGVNSSSKHCVLCTDQNCLECINIADTCSRCKIGYHLVEGTCVACHSTCLTCSGPGESDCLTCIRGKVHSAGTGPSTCISECIENSRNCLQCNAIISGTAYCSQCAVGHYPINGDCRATARDLICLNGEDGICTHCAPGYFLYSGGCYQSERLPGSYVCAQSATGEGVGICNKCQLGYMPLSGSCTPCESINCQVCEYSVDICTVCSDGYYGDNCVQCPKACASCKSNLQCTRCAEGYFAAIDYEIFDPSHCIACSDEEGKDGYIGKQGCLSCIGPAIPGPVLCLSEAGSYAPVAPLASSTRLPLIIGLSVTVVVLLLVALGILLWKLLSAKKLNRTRCVHLPGSTTELLAGASGTGQSMIFDSINLSIN